MYRWLGDRAVAGIALAGRVLLVMAIGAMVDAGLFDAELGEGLLRVLRGW